jgi:hypothetical protein
MSSGFDAASRVTEFYAAFARVKELVADFRANEKFYLSPAYQEQEARRDFIDKFWLALGWDVNHETQKNPFEQEVKVERKEHGFSQRRADYAFYLAPNFRDVKFYVEAKKPHGDIATADNYFQTARYGWSSSTPVAVLHDFEQFEIVDCRYRPHIDTALAQNLRKYHFSHYEDPEKFAEIYWLFSREAVANGSVEKLAETLPKKRGRGIQRGLLAGAFQSIDEAFLEELDEFRDELARAFKNANPNLDGETHKFQGLDFQNGNTFGRIHSRSDGRCLFKKETFSSDGCHSVERQQRHRIEISIHSSCARNQRLAAAPAVARQTRFHFPPRAARIVCGRLLLARLPKAWAKSRQQPRLLAPEARTQQAERQDGIKTVAKGRLACATSLGARPKQPRVGHQKTGFWIECQLTIVDHASLKL